ncbi:MAG: 2Fe-2S iron-sulfur cluster binding domain-containing protein, partial [Bdellovibrionales bacterium]|nr:2Fe-2S iron-sulfur cluster binding domain-containing protein [Bdellovibrionales bacterium]
MFHKKPKNKPNSTLVFEPMGLKADIKGNVSVLDLALSQGIDIPHSCEGMGSCTSCRILLTQCPTGIPQ